MNKYFSDIKKNFGFGMMRLPMNGEDVDYEQVNQMVDTFIEKGFNYFDTAHGYIGGLSEKAIKKCLSSRYPRDSYILTNKLSNNFFQKQEDIVPLLKTQLEACGVDYFDFYLMHAQSSKNFGKYKACKAYETAFECKKQGLVRHVGISFHDSPAMLDTILSEYPEIEIVQIQFNYLDYEDGFVESKGCLDVCIKHNKPVIVMEPVKGGALVNLPKEALSVFDELNSDASIASYAIRYAASFDQMCMVLSGMSNMDQMNDNLSFMQDFKPINDKEMEVIRKVVSIYKSLHVIPCTACHYCVHDNKCPKNIMIPDLIDLYNKLEIFHDKNEQQDMYNWTTSNSGKASECIQCGMCEKICPQQIDIRNQLQMIAKEFE